MCRPTYVISYSYTVQNVAIIFLILPSPQAHSYEPTVLVHSALSGHSFHDDRHSSRSPQEPTVPVIPKNPVLQLQENDPPLLQWFKNSFLSVNGLYLLLMNFPVDTGSIFITVVSSCSALVDINANASSIGFKPVLTCLNTFRNQIMAKKDGFFVCCKKSHLRHFWKKFSKLIKFSLALTKR